MAREREVHRLVTGGGEGNDASVAEDITSDEDLFEDALF
jgi:hypothetical protein